MSIVLFQASGPLQLHPCDRIKILPHRSQGLPGGPQRDPAFLLRHNPPYKLPPRLSNEQHLDILPRYVNPYAAATFTGG